ncbi:MAG TPA: hypothetical protein DCE17_04925, partial [Lactobacillus sp.]|nr:hypothetical protein [Lactobacillus sp.]
RCIICKKYAEAFFMNSEIVTDIVYILEKYEMTMLDEKVMSVATTVKNLLVSIKEQATLGRFGV